jgi:hypothetical protein
MATEQIPRGALSKHATCRMNQRGISQEDIETVRNHGIQIRDGYLMTRKTIAARRSDLNRELQQLDKLDGVAVIEAEQTIVTTYRTDRKTFRRLRSTQQGGQER